jgi:hypothetical protein
MSTTNNNIDVNVNNKRPRDEEENTIERGRRFIMEERMRGWNYNFIEEQAKIRQAAKLAFENQDKLTTLYVKYGNITEMSKSDPKAAAFVIAVYYEVFRLQELDNIINMYPVVGEQDSSNTMNSSNDNVRISARHAINSDKAFATNLMKYKNRHITARVDPSSVHFRVAVYFEALRMKKMQALLL